MYCIVHVPSEQMPNKTLLDFRQHAMSQTICPDVTYLWIVFIFTRYCKHGVYLVRYTPSFTV